MKTETFVMPPESWKNAQGIYLARMDFYVITPGMNIGSVQCMDLGMPMMSTGAFYLETNQEMVVSFVDGKLRMRIQDREDVTR